MNLFETLMPVRTGTSSTSKQPKSFGREDYVTYAVALVLQADAGGTLVDRVLHELFGIELHGTPRVTAQHEHSNLGWGTSYIDLQITTDVDLVLVENKTGIQLGTRVNPDTGEAIDQLEKYAMVLDASPIAEANRHLAMLVWAPQPNQGGRYFRGARYWWDLYQVIAATTPTGDTYADRVREQLLAFFQ